MLAGAGVAGCGAEDFPNEPRPPSGVELSAKIDDKRVVFAPGEIGAGLAQVTISNQSSEDVELEFIDGVGKKQAETNEISAGGVGTLQIELTEGDYEIAPSVDSIDSGTLAVGPERESAQNDLLLP